MNGSHAIHLSKDKTTGIKVDLVNYTLFGKLIGPLGLKFEDFFFYLYANFAWRF